MIGQTLSHYEIQAKLGEGGMGVVYRARDTRLDRTAAIKVLRPEAVGDPERKWRFVREAKAASALNHPNIVTIYDIDSANGVDFIAMEYVEGQSLDRLIPKRGLPLEEAVSYAVQIAGALAAAHAAGIVHRDVKPANVMVTSAGQVKVLDFGLAKLIEAGAEVPATSSVETDLATGRAVPRTQQGVVLGTLSYMSPEQAQGKPVDARSDVFSFGTVLYEMLAGRRPFQGDSHILTITAILRDSPAPMKAVRPEVPGELERIVRKCLEKNRESRFPSASELLKELIACQSRLAAPDLRLKYVLARPQFLVPAALLFLAAAGAVAWFAVRSSRARWARSTALPEIARLVEKERYAAAWNLARRALRFLPEDEELQRLWRETSVSVSVRTTPPGADVSFQEYAASGGGWEPLGRSPLENVRIPGGYLHWRVTKADHTAAEGALSGWTTPIMEFRLDPLGAEPPGMVRVPGGTYQFRSADPVELEEFWLDKHEVTNQQFKEFVDRGGYEKREYWKHPFVKEGRTLSWEEAMAEFRDATGRPGPSTWELGSYPEGRADYPASGVSWYEAAAYAEFAGKSLPTVYHWYRAAAMGAFSDILRLSNFSGRGPSRIGERPGLARYGTYDMAGNVKEWCWNRTSNRRYILGGAWNEPSYMFRDPDAQFPFERSATYGFRCAKYAAPLEATLLRPIETLSRDFTKEKPAGDDVFQAYRSIYFYDPSELAPAVESVDKSSSRWRKEKITFNAVYGGERVIAYLFLPRNAAPPYQTVVYFPGAHAFRLSTFEDLEWWVDFIVRSGRALLHPIYKGTYERRLPASPEGPNARRELVIQLSKDLQRSMDYLETRGDIDRERLAYYGFSRGAAYGPIFSAIEPRLKTSVLLLGGLYDRRDPPEIEPIHFAPRAKAPVLMINGRYDFTFPLESSQTMFRLLGAPEKDKRHVLLDSGHVPPRIQSLVKEVLDWLDRYLGPVKTRPSASP